MSADNTPPQTADDAHRRTSGHLCPECGLSFVLRHPRQIFCSDDHKQAFESRAATRARKVFAHAFAARLTRDGTRGDRATGRKASTIAAQLFQRFRDDDAANPKRMNAVQYAALRYKLGFDQP